MALASAGQNSPLLGELLSSAITSETNDLVSVSTFDVYPLNRLWVVALCSSFEEICISKVL